MAGCCLPDSSHGAIRAGCGWQQEIAHGQLGSAQHLLAALRSAARRLGGRADYWLGICEALASRPEAALRAFGRLPAEYPFDPVGAYHEAKANLSRGKLHPAERRLVQALARGGPGLDQVRELLSHIYQIQGRFDDYKLLRQASLADAQDPVRVLRQLSGLDFDRLPYDGLQATLEKAGELAPQDDRVWLGKGRMAIEAGRWEEARKWLGRCRAADLADGPVWRAWLKLGRGSGRPDEAVDAARQLGPEGLDESERLALRAWLQERQGDAQAETGTLEHWLRIEPAATAALERLAELAQRAGQLARGMELRRRKAEVERSLAGYRDRLRSDRPLQTASERYELARLAAAAGRHREARALLNWALLVDPGDRSVRELLTGLDQADSERLGGPCGRPGALVRDRATPPIPESRSGSDEGWGSRLHRRCGVRRSEVRLQQRRDADPPVARAFWRRTCDPGL